MKLTEFISDVGRPVAYYPGLKKITKSTTATILLCQLIYWTGKQADPNGWIYKTSEDLEEETGLTYDEQKTARTQLVKLGFIEEVYRRLDHQMSFRIMANAINENWRTGEHGIPQSDDTALGNEALPDSLTETTAQSTQKNTKENTTQIDVVNIFKLYEHTVGILTPMMADELRQAEKDYPAEWLPEAFLLAEKANVRKWNYILAILKKWKTEGRGAPQHKAAKVTKLEPILE